MESYKSQIPTIQNKKNSESAFSKQIGHRTNHGAWKSPIKLSMVWVNIKLDWGSEMTNSFNKKNYSVIFLRDKMLFLILLWAKLGLGLPQE